MLHDIIIPGTEELLNKETVSGYIGFDPTADSLDVGNLIDYDLIAFFGRQVINQLLWLVVLQEWLVIRPVNGRT